LLNRVEEFAHHDRRWDGDPVDRVGAGIEDEEVILRRDDGVKECLTILVARRSLPDERVEGEDVVPVDRLCSREGLAIHAEQDDRAVRDRPHRHHRTDGELTGAEVRPGRSRCNEVFDEVAHIRRG